MGQLVSELTVPLLSDLGMYAEDSHCREECVSTKGPADDMSFDC